jgi:hypothetical protein
MTRLLALLSLLASGCILPYAVPPARLDFGGAHVMHGGNVFHFAAGLHTASAGEIVPHSDRFDAGIGVVLNAQQGGLRDHGFYAGGDYFLRRREHTRIGLGARGEYLIDDGISGGGLYGRLTLEAFNAGNGGGSGQGNCSATSFAWRGAPGTALYAEAGGQMLPDGRTAFVSTAGLSIRLPAVAGLLFMVPGCGE